MNQIGYISEYWCEKDKCGNDKICCTVILTKFYIGSLKKTLTKCCKKCGKNGCLW